MLRSILIGLVAGQRAMTPLALVAGAARNRKLPDDAPLGAVIANPLVSAGAVTLAAGEMAGDKQHSAPDRIIAPGLIARGLTAAYAAAAFAPRGRRWTAAGVAAATAIVASHVGFRLRMASMERFSQEVTGFVEDAIVLGSGLAITQR